MAVNKKSMTTTDKKASASTMVQTATKSSMGDISDKKFSPASMYQTATKSSMPTTSKTISGNYSAYTPDVEIDYDDYSGGSRRGSGGGGGGGDEGYYEDPGAGFDYGSFIYDMLLNQKANADYIYQTSMDNLNNSITRQLANAANSYNKQKGNTQTAYDDANKRIDANWEKTASALLTNKDNALKTLESNYNTILKNLDDNYGITSKNLESNYEFGRNEQNADAERSLREAYINYMMNRRNINQNLAAAGLSGGATESTLAKMYNNYGSARNDINNLLASNLNRLLQSYNTNLAEANKEYNTNKTNAGTDYSSRVTDAENAYRNNYTNAQTNYTNYLTDLGLNRATALSALEDAYAKTQREIEDARTRYSNDYVLRYGDLINDMLSGNSLNNYADFAVKMSELGATPASISLAIPSAANMVVPAMSALADMDSYTKALASAANGLNTNYTPGNYSVDLSYTPTANNLGIDLYNTAQANNMGTVTDYAKYLAMLEQMGA